MQLISAPKQLFQKRNHIKHITLSILVPVYNESEMLTTFHHEVCKVAASLPDENIELLYVNDGSTDDSWSLLESLKSNIVNIERINLSRNFGKEAAMTAGLDLVKGESVILLDADLQDPPSLIPQMLSKWREGFDVVNMKRTDRLGESRFKTASAHIYYRLLAALSDVPIEKDVGDFRLLSRRVIDHIKQLPERNRYMKGIMAWPGFKQTNIEFERPERVAGETKWSFFQLVKLGLSGITSFSVKPLKIATWLGASISIGAFLYSVFVMFKTLILGDPVAGYPSMMIVQLWLGGVQLIAIGVLGEYVGRIFVESKGRPVYLVMDSHSSKAKHQEAEHG